MKVEDEFHIAVDDVHLRINIEATGSLSPNTENPRPRWKDDYAKQGERFAAALEKVRESLQMLDTDEYVPAGLSGMGLGDVFVAIDRNAEEVVIQEGSHENVIGKISKDRLRELAEEENEKSK